MNKPKVGVQLIIYGSRPQEDLEGVLKEIADAGYDGVEGGNLLQYATSDKIKRLFKSYGLALAGVHSGFKNMAQREKVDGYISFLKSMDARYLMCSGVGDQKEGIKWYENAAKTLDDVGRRCNEGGLTLCYHNHAWEFKTFNGVKGIHRLIELTDPKLVKLCIDVYWVHIGGESPAEFIRRYKDRAVYFHFKDGKPGKFMELGAGEVDFGGIMKVVSKLPVDWVIYEQDRTDLTPKESVTISRKFLRDKCGL
ncbi:MAG: sugar phosphate isomerase/epimerase family protein [bacterium]